MKRLMGALLLLGLFASSTDASLVYRRLNAKALRASQIISDGKLAVLSFETASVITNTSMTGSEGYLEVKPAFVAELAVPYNPGDVATMLATSIAIKRMNVYPNPIRTNEWGHVYYELTKDTNVEVIVFDMIGRTVAKQSIKAASLGGQMGINKVSLSELGLNPATLSSGAYFFFLYANGKVLAKGKMAVVAG